MFGFQRLDPYRAATDMARSSISFGARLYRFRSTSRSEATAPT